MRHPLLIDSEQDPGYRGTESCREAEYDRQEHIMDEGLLGEPAEGPEHVTTRQEHHGIPDDREP